MDPLASPSHTDTLDLPRIVRTPGTCGGKPRIDGHRIKVEHIAVCYERLGLTPDEIVAQHPTLTLAQVHAALAYYFDHKDEIDADLADGLRFADQLKAASPPSVLQQLLQARNSAHAPDDPLPPG